MSEKGKRIILKENTDIQFDVDDKGFTVMKVCGEVFCKKKLPVPFTQRNLQRFFHKEIEQHKDFVCPTGL